MIRHVADVQPFAPSIAGVENLLEILQAADNLLVVRQRAVTEIVNRVGRFVAGDNPVGQPRKLLFEPYIGCHDETLPRGSLAAVTSGQSFAKENYQSRNEATRRGQMAALARPRTLTLQSAELVAAGEHERQKQSSKTW